MAQPADVAILEGPTTTTIATMIEHSSVEAGGEAGLQFPAREL
jgi:hypothetical protein